MNSRQFEIRKYWMQIVHEVMSDNLTDTDWCKEHDIDHDAFKYRKMVFRDKGILDDLIGSCPGFTECGMDDGRYLKYRSPAFGVNLYFVDQPIGSTSINSIVWMIRSSLNLDPYHGDIFLFRRSNNREMFTYSSDGNIECYRKVKFTRYVLRWPERMADDTHARISEKQLGFILNCINR